jgi:hypothetical protein
MGEISNAVHFIWHAKRGSVIVPREVPLWVRGSPIRSGPEGSSRNDFFLGRGWSFHFIFYQ